MWPPSIPRVADGVLVFSCCGTDRHELRCSHPRLLTWAPGGLSRSPLRASQGETDVCETEQIDTRGARSWAESTAPWPPPSGLIDLGASGGAAVPWWKLPGCPPRAASPRMARPPPLSLAPRLPPLPRRRELCFQGVHTSRRDPSR